MKRLVKISLGTALTMMLTAAGSGCATTSERFSAISTRNNLGIEPSVGVGAGEPAPAKNVAGESCRRSVLFIPISGRSSLGDAVDEALSKAPGMTLLTDAKVEREWLFTLFYNYHCVHIEGRPITTHH